MRRNKKNFEIDLDDFIEDDDTYEIEEVVDDAGEKRLDDEYDKEKEYEEFFKVNEDEEEFTEEEVKTTKYETKNEKDTFVDVESDDEDEVEYNDENSTFMKILSIFSVWFSRLGIAIAIILIAVFISQGKFKSLLLYILCLVVSFFFGYFFMFLLTHFTENN